MNKIIFLLVCMAFNANVLAGDQINLTNAQQQTLGITVSPLNKKTSFSSQRLPASVVVPVGQERVISAAQPGLIDALYIAAGQDVRKGQALAHISSPDLVGLQRDYLQALTQKKLAANMLQRDNELYKDGIIAQRRVLTTQSSHDEISASLTQRKQTLKLAGMGDAAIARLESSGQMSSGLTLTAPMDGQVLEQMVAVGQRVEIATPIYRIAQLKPLWLEIHAPLELLASTSLGMKVNVPKYQATGKLIAIVRSVNKNDQTVHLRALIEQGAEKLSPGQFVEVQFSEVSAAQDKANRFTVPRSAVARNGADSYIFVQTAKGFDAKKVEIVSEQTDDIVINADLSGNEKVAVTGLVAIKGSWLGLGAE